MAKRWTLSSFKLKKNFFDLKKNFITMDDDDGHWNVVRDNRQKNKKKTYIQLRETKNQKLGNKTFEKSRRLENRETFLVCF